MLEDLLRKGLLKALEKYGVFEEDLQIELEKPRERSHGDVSTNVALILGRRLKRKPRELAGEIAAEVSFPREIIESVEIAGPGFINFRLAHDHQIELLMELWHREGALEDIRTGAGKRINVEFISANPTGPLNVVSARAGAFGMTLVRLLDAVGYDAHAEYYVNDAGRQVTMLGRSLRAHYLQLAGDPVEFPDEGYHGRYLEVMAGSLMGQDSEAVKQAAAAFNDESFQRISAPVGNAEDWRQLPEDQSIRCFAKYALMKILGWQRDTCRRFGLRFETWYFESELHETKRIERASERLVKQNATFEDEGAIWFRSTDYGDEKDRVLVRADGRPTYFLADIAYHYHKFQRGFERAVDFWGPDHHGYIQRIQGAMLAMGVPRDWLEIQILQHVNFLEGGKPIKMSKRAGSFVTMSDLIDEVGADVAKYFFLARKPNSHLDFDLDLARDHTDKNPLYKVWYAHARTCSLLTRAAELSITVEEPSAESLRHLDHELEWNLVREMIRLPQVIVSAARAREPHRLVGYADDIAKLYNEFYTNSTRVLGKKILEQDGERRQAQLQLCLLARHVIRIVLDLIGVSAPERMEEKD